MPKDTSISGDPGPGQEQILLAGLGFFVRSGLRKLLVEHGYGVIEAVNDVHASALVTTLNNRIDLVLLDASYESEPPGWLRHLPGIPVIFIEPLVQANGSSTLTTYRLSSHCPERVLEKLSAALRGPGERKSILVVDENEFVRRSISFSLDSAGYDIHEAANGREALSTVASRKVDIVLTEVVLPEMDGLMLIQALRKSEPGVKIIAMSGSSRADTYLNVARTLGASATLYKPVPIEHLLQTLRKVLRTEPPGQGESSVTSEDEDGRCCSIVLDNQFLSPLPTA